MPIVQPTPHHYTMEERGSSVAIIIPSRKQMLTLGFLLLWIAGWAVGEAAVGFVILMGLLGMVTGDGATFGDAGSSISGSNIAALGIVVFVVVWWVLWTLGGLLALRQVAWQLTGREVIDVSHEAITIQRRILGMGRPQAYLAEHVQDLRLWVDRTYDMEPTSTTAPGTGALAFDYGAREIRFGPGLARSEAREILALLQRRYPHYQGV